MKIAKFFNRTDTTKKSKNYFTDYLTSKKTNDTNPTSLFGTIFTVSTSALAGITESVITPGFRFLKFVSEIMTFYKKLVHNFSTISSKFERINSILENFGLGGNTNHIRNSIVKYKVKSKK